MKKLLFYSLCILLLDANAQHRSASGSILLKKLFTEEPAKTPATLRSSVSATACLLDSTTAKYWTGIDWAGFYKVAFFYDSKSNPWLEMQYNRFATSSWNLTGRISRAYDPSNNLLTEARDSWDEFQQVWNPTGLTTNTYNSANKLLVYLFQTRNFQSNSWNNSYRSTHTYDSKNNPASSLEEYFDLTFFTWRNISLSSFTSNVTGLITQEIYQQWNDTTNGWKNQYKINYTYDIFGNMITGTLHIPSGNGWISDERVAATYNGNKILTFLFDYWDSATNNWIKSEKGTYSYDGNGNQLQELYQEWDLQLSAWVNYNRSTNTFDIKNNQLTNLNETWQNMAWAPTYRSTFHYDAWNNQTYNLSEEWNGSISQWENSSQKDSYHNCTTVGLRSFESASGKLLYPNPAQDKLFIANGENVSAVIIMDVSGNEIYSGTHTTSIDVSNLPPGVYFLHLLSNKHAVISSGKFIKE